MKAKDRIWRAPGRVAWSLYAGPQKRQALAELDRAFELAVTWMRMHVRHEGPSPEILDAAFDAMGRTLRRWAHLGAMDTEPLANVRRALASTARPTRRQGLDYTPRAFPGARELPDGPPADVEQKLSKLGLLADSDDSKDEPSRNGSRRAAKAKP